MVTWQWWQVALWKNEKMKWYVCMPLLRWIQAECLADIRWGKQTCLSAWAWLSLSLYLAAFFSCIILHSSIIVSSLWHLLDLCLTIAWQWWNMQANCAQKHSSALWVLGLSLLARHSTLQSVISKQPLWPIELLNVLPSWVFQKLMVGLRFLTAMRALSGDCMAESR